MTLPKYRRLPMQFTTYALKNNVTATTNSGKITGEGKTSYVFQT